MTNLIRRLLHFFVKRKTDGFPDFNARIPLFRIESKKLRTRVLLSDKNSAGGESAAPVSDNYQNVTPIDAIFTTMDSIRVDYLSGGEKFREKCCCKWQVRGIVKKAHPEIKICTVET